MARLSCLRLFWQAMRAAASRTFWTAGSSRPIRTAMIAITTSSSMSVNPERWRRAAAMANSLRTDEDLVTHRANGRDIGWAQSSAEKLQGAESNVELNHGRRRLQTESAGGPPTVLVHPRPDEYL